MHNFKIVFFYKCIAILNICISLAKKLKNIYLNFFMFNEYYCFVYNILHKLSIAYKYLFSEINLHFLEN